MHSTTAITSRYFMSCGGPRVKRLAAAIVLLFLAPGVSRECLRAQDAAGSSKKAAPATTDDEAELRMEEMTQIAHAFKFVAVDGATRAPAELMSEPLHRWTDPTRPFSGGASGRAGRGAVRSRFSALSFTLPGRSSSCRSRRGWSRPLMARSSGRRNKPASSSKRSRAHPVPADDAAKRLRQMRDVLKRITASEFYDGKHYALRLLPHPIDRYADPATGLVDGAIFIYANGTNPETLLLIEARAKGKGTGSPVWSYAAAPLSRAEPTLKLDGKDLWTSPTKRQTSPDQTYYDVLKGRGFRARGDATLAEGTAVNRLYKHAANTPSDQGNEPHESQSLHEFEDHVRAVAEGSPLRLP